MTHRRPAALALGLLALTAGCGGGSAVGSFSAPPSTSSAAPSSAAPEIVVTAAPEPIEASVVPSEPAQDYFADGMFGLYSGDGFVYGAIEGCGEFFAGAGDNTYVLVDGQTKNTLDLTLLYDTESDDALFELRRSGESEPFFAELLPYTLSSVEGQSRMTAESGSDRFELLLVDETTESEDCVDG